MRTQLIYRDDAAELQLIAETEGEQHILRGLQGFLGRPRVVIAGVKELYGAPADNGTYVFGETKGGFFSQFKEHYSEALALRFDRSPEHVPEDPRIAAIRAVERAYSDAGPAPEVHRRAQRYLREKWPTLHRALMDLIGERDA